MTPNADFARGRRFTGSVAVLAALLGLFNLWSYVEAAGGDANLFLEPGKALALSPGAINLFHWSMLADTLGWYVLPLVLGGYLRSRLRGSNGAMIDIATLGLVVYATLGTIGAVMQSATLQPLAAMYQTGDGVAKAAAVGSWTAVVNAATNGFWWIEALPLAFWCLVVGASLRHAGHLHGWLLSISGVAWAVCFALLALTGRAFIETPEIVALLTFIGWVGWAGIWLLCERKSAAA